MAPTARKGKENGKKVSAKGGKDEAPAAASDADDGILDMERYGHWTDSIILLSAARALMSSILEFRKSRNAGSAAAGKKGKGADKAAGLDKEAVTRTLSDYKIPLGLMTIFVLTCALILGGEITRDEQDRPVEEVADDYYGVLGVPRDAETADVKRAYKILAKRWHPDKNLNCTSCQDTFSKIAEAYETLADEAKRAVYDESGGIATADLQSARSVPLTRENFERTVLFSNDVWIVQVFKPKDSFCAQIHPFWEHQIQKHGHLVRFGRIDVTNDLALWLPVKIRVLPTILKFGRHLGSPEIFPLTQAHQTPAQLNKFVVTSFPNIGLPLQADEGALRRWLEGSSRRHKVLFAIPGKSEDERYKSHLGCRKLAAQWSELFEFRIAETAMLHKIGKPDVPPKVMAALPNSSDASSKAAILFFSADGNPVPKASVILEWPVPEEDALVLPLLDMAELAAPSLSARSAELLCKSLASRRVYCLVLVDPYDNAVARAVTELKQSRAQYTEEVMEIREQGSEVGKDEDNFIVTAVRLFRSPRGLQPSVASCRAPKFSQLDSLLSSSGSGAFLMDFDTRRIAALTDISSFSNIYPQIGYEDSLTWVEDALDPFLSLPDCDEGMLEFFARSLRSSRLWELVVQLLGGLLFVEASAKLMVDGSIRWGCGAASLLALALLRSPPFLRMMSSYLPGFLFTASPLLADF